MASYSQSVLDEIRAAVDIVDVVNRFVNQEGRPELEGPLPVPHGEDPLLHGQ